MDSDNCWLEFAGRKWIRTTVANPFKIVASFFIVHLISFGALHCTARQNLNFQFQTCTGCSSSLCSGHVAAVPQVRVPDDAQLLFHPRGAVAHRCPSRHALQPGRFGHRPTECTTAAEPVGCLLNSDQLGILTILKETMLVDFFFAEWCPGADAGRVRLPRRGLAVPLQRRQMLRLHRIREQTKLYPIQKARIFRGFLALQEFLSSNQ